MWKQIIDVDLSGVFYGLKYEIPALLAAGGGAIVNMASIAGMVGFAQSPAYVAAKHGVVGLTKTAALEYAKQGIRINSIGPGIIETPMVTEHANPDMVKQISAIHPIGRVGKPEEVAELTCFLLSSQAAFITASYNVIDGGYIAQ
jgi:NAD(P)-dependent dehydrogenase (short-subunit alcohol dehydrogenase family)